MVPKWNTPSNPSINSTINSSCAQFQQTVHTLLGGTSPPSILSAMLSLNSVTSIIVALNGMGEAIEAIVQALNALPTTFATDFPRLPVAVSIANKCHPLMLQTYKPVLTTGDVSCPV